MSKKIVPSFSSVRCRRISMERWWRSSSGGKNGGDEWLLQNLGERMVGEQRNHAS